MKIKGSKTSVTLSGIPKILGISTLICIIIRAIQMLKFIDNETGFTTGGTVLGIILVLVLAATVIAFMAKGYLSAESPKIQLQGIKSKNLGMVTLLFALTLAFDFVSGFTAAGGDTSADFKGMMLTGTMPRFLQSIFALFAAFYFIFLAKDYFKGASTASKHRVLAIMPVCWAGFRMICRFVRQISFVKVSDLFYELIMLAFMLIFFMAFAQVVSGVYSDGFEWRIPAFGASAALVAGMLSVPRLIFTFVGYEDYINPQHTFQITDLAFFAFVIVLSATVCKKNNPYTAYGVENGDE